MALLTALLVYATAPAQATTIKRMALKDVARAAGRIVQGRVTDVQSGRDEDGLPATWVTVAVARTLKGPETATLVIKQFGVASPLPDGTLTRVPGLPHYRVDEQLVLFLHAPSKRGFTSPVGFGQGVYRVESVDGRLLVRGDWAAERAVSLDKFLAEVGRLTRWGR